MKPFDTKDIPTDGADAQGHSVRVLTDWPEFEAIEEAWRDLHARAHGGIHSSFDWFMALKQSFGNEGPLFIVTLWRGDQLKAAAPLCRARRRISKLASWYKPETLVMLKCRYNASNEFLAEDDAAFDRLVSEMARLAKGRAFDFEMLVQDDRLDRLARNLDQSGYASRSWPRSESSVIAGVDSWDGYLAAKSRNFRKTAKKEERAIEASGATLDPCDAADPQVLERAYDVSRRSWKEDTGSGMAATDQIRALSRELWMRFAARGDGLITFLQMEGKDIAFTYMVRVNGDWTGIWTEFDEAYADISPGRTIISMTVKGMLDRGQITGRWDMMRATYFTKKFETESYFVRDFRAMPKAGFARLLTETETALRQVAGNRRFFKKKKRGREDVVTQEATSQMDTMTMQSPADLKVEMDTRLEGDALKEALAFIDASPPGCYLQRPDWPDLCPPPSHHSYKVLRARDGNGKLVGLGLVRLTKLPLGRSFAALRRGPVTRTLAELAPVTQAFADTLRDSGCVNLFVNPRWAGEDARKAIEILRAEGAEVLPPAEQSLHNATLLVDLSGTEEELFMRLKQRCRTDVRKAAKLGLEVRPAATLEEARLYEDMFETFQQNRGLSYDAVPPVEKLWEMTRERGAFLLSWYEGQPVAGFVVTPDGDTAFSMTVCTSVELRGVPINHGQFWEALRISREQGFKYFDLAGAPTSEQIAKGIEDEGEERRYKFKMAFRPEHVDLVPTMVMRLRPLEHKLLYSARKLYRKMRGKG